MKYTLCALAAIAGLLLAQTLKAQDTVATQNKNKKHRHTSISLGNKGFQIGKYDTSLNHKKQNQTDPDTGFSTHWVMLDLGFNTMQDKTDYNSAPAKNFLNVPAGNKNASLFNLRTGKSININIYPFMETFNALHTKNQQINISTGIGLQLYNFSYEEPVTFTRNPNSVTLESTSFKKDKLAFDFLNVPLMFTFKTRIYHHKYLVYGVGVTEGYNLATWTKQESGQYGKVKVRDIFNFTDFNTCITGEIGIFDGIRFYGSYQLTNLYNSGLNQHPITFGFRIFAI